MGGNDIIWLLYPVSDCGVLQLSAVGGDGLLISTAKSKGPSSTPLEPMATRYSVLGVINISMSAVPEHS